MPLKQEKTSVFSRVSAMPGELTSVTKTKLLISKCQEVIDIISGKEPSVPDFTPLVIVGPSGAGKGTLIEHLT